MRRLLRAAVAALPMVLAAGDWRAATADETIHPVWMKVDAAAKSVSLDIVAGWNPNNGALNFDGYYKGDATVVVPVGWKVHVAFRNNDGMLPHSLLVTKPFAEQDLPQLLGADKVAIPRAYTVSPEEGIPAPKTDTVDFTTGDPGKFFFICGAPGHAQSGMWIHFNVDANARAPVLIVATGAEPGWK